MSQYISLVHCIVFANEIRLMCAVSLESLVQGCHIQARGPESATQKSGNEGLSNTPLHIKNAQAEFSLFKINIEFGA